METKPLVSIIINNYNYDRFLAEAIDSALSQTYPHTEVIVVDDGSTDNSRNIIASYGERIIPILQENGKQAAAFNSGFAISQGEIIIFLDSDDYLFPHTVERIVSIWKPHLAKVHYRLNVVDTFSRSLGYSCPQGALLSTELIFSPGEEEYGKDYSKFSLGVWYYTSDFENTTDGKKQNGNYGAYVSAEQFFYSESSSSEQGLALFGRFGIANSNFNPSDYSIVGGAIYIGLIPGLDKDVFGLAFTSIHLADKFRQVEEFEASIETILELTYSFQVSNWLKLQPDLQYIFNPVAAPNSDYAFTAGLRAEVAL